ncbi:AAA-like domain-containing protein [Lusitaniella coriacea]|uniref:AAA-like domain-containing protein n=1 Tax=Lusitaniella coriacea TaxID=1983105 RepID=UPI003CECFF35
MDTLKVSSQGLAIIERAIRRKGWTKTQTAAFWDAACTSQATLRRFWQGKRIQRETFIAVCEAVGIEHWQAIAELEVVEDIDFPSSGTSEEISFPSPEDSVHPESLFYIQRPPLEEQCYKEMMRPGGLIRIKAPRQMGKTSLLARILHHSTQQDYRTVRLNLLQAEESVFSSVERFLRWFCACTSHKLRLPSKLDDYWDRDRGSIINCTIYFEVCLLDVLDTPLVLALDEVDRAFEFPAVARSFFPMLRSWHEEAKTIPSWEKLRLVVAHSTENYGTLDINQSPFNVGLPVELAEFTPEQVKELALRHKLPWDDKQVKLLMQSIGGHPYLVRLALYHLALENITLEQLLQDAPTAAGIYEEHLRRHWVKLNECPQLFAAMQRIALATEPISIETMQAYQLYSMGLIQRSRDRVMPSCQLYRKYFQEHS